ncbi:MAG: hypothetical protein MSS69_05195 [Spirochaetales bacterium]|nr:hypothetical protein [Spirochaetales bacterium]
MAEYTYKDIIIDPTSEEAKNAIGKEVYFADTPASCLNAAKNNNKAYLGYLKKLDLGDEEQPFYVNEFVVSAPSSWTCIIVKKKEPKPKYVQFQDGREFFNSYLSVESRLEKEDYFLSNHGIWLMDCENGYYFLVTEIWGDGVVLGSNQTTTHWDDLLEDFIFLDGSPCGKEVEDE